MVEGRKISTPPEIKFHPEQINGIFKGKDILSMYQFDPSSLEELFKVIQQMSEIPKNEPSQILAGNVIALIFDEPSTRTRFSTETGVLRLGGGTVFSEKKSRPSGDSLEETIRKIAPSCDAIVIRHPDPGSAEKAAKISSVPVINAGDGKGGHPTQALGDLYTILKKKGRLSGLKGLMARDLKNSRVVHSQLEGLSLYPNNIIYLLSQEELRLPKEMIKKLRERGLKIIEIQNDANIPKGCDFWSWTRLQKERYKKDNLLKEYDRLNKYHVIDRKYLQEYGNKKLIILDPQPIVGEVTEGIRCDPRWLSDKEQIRNAHCARMALLALVLGK